MAMEQGTSMKSGQGEDTSASTEVKVDAQDASDPALSSPDNFNSEFSPPPKPRD